MIIITLKNGYSFAFEMMSWDKEKVLVDKFNSKNLSAESVLDLKRLGSYKVEEINEMEFNPTKTIKKEKNSNKENRLKNFSEAISRYKEKNR